MTRTVRLPLAWRLIPTVLAAGAWVAVPFLAPRSTPWLGCSLGLAVGLTIFAAFAWGQRVRLRDDRLWGHAFLRRSVDLGVLTTCRVGGNTLAGGARSNEVLLLEDARGSRVTVPLNAFPAARRSEIATTIRPAIVASGVKLDAATLAFLDGSGPAEMGSSSVGSR